MKGATITILDELDPAGARRGIENTMARLRLDGSRLRLDGSRVRLRLDGSDE